MYLQGALIVFQIHYDSFNCLIIILPNPIFVFNLTSNCPIYTCFGFTVLFLIFLDISDCSFFPKNIPYPICPGILLDSQDYYGLHILLVNLKRIYTSLFLTIVHSLKYSLLCFPKLLVFIT